MISIAPILVALMGRKKQDSIPQFRVVSEEKPDYQKAMDYLAWKNPGMMFYAFSHLGEIMYATEQVEK